MSTGRERGRLGDRGVRKASFWPSTHRTDIHRAKEDPQAEERVIRRYQDAVYRFARWKGLRHEDAEEIANSVFAGDFLRKTDLERPKKGGFHSYIQRHATNQIITFWEHAFAAKRNPRRLEPRDIENLERDARKKEPLGAIEIPIGMSAEDTFDWGYVRQLLNQALKDMGDDVKTQAFRRRKIDGRTSREIAYELGVSEKHVDLWVHRKTEWLKERICDLIRADGDSAYFENEIEWVLRFIARNSRFSGYLK